MITAEQFLAFLFAAVLITVTPGPDNLMVLGMGVSKGRRQGMAFGFGCALGCISHTAMAVVGVSAVVAASPFAFGVLKTVGGLYLFWLGVQSLRSTGAMKLAGMEMQEQPLFRLFFKGVFANAINPKVVLFFLSFLPQFVVQEHGAVGWQMATLGVVFTLQAALLFGLLGYFSGTVGGWLGRVPRAGLWLDRAAGAVFIGLGARMLLG